MSVWYERSRSQRAISIALGLVTVVSLGLGLVALLADSYPVGGTRCGSLNSPRIDIPSSSPEDRVARFVGCNRYYAMQGRALTILVLVALTAFALNAVAAVVHFKRVSRRDREFKE